MSRRRDRPDGLPFRLYERVGKRTYSIGFKEADGTWTFRLSCLTTDTIRRRELRREAIARVNGTSSTPSPGGHQLPKLDTFGLLVDEWFRHQQELPTHAATKRKDSTIAENRREAANLLKAFGPMLLRNIHSAHLYAYLDACDKNGRAAKGNKEISLMRLILNHAVRYGKLAFNPATGVGKLATKRSAHLVQEHELDLVVVVGRRLGGRHLIVALALKTAYLCCRRSTEVRGLKRSQLTAEGIVWTASKNRATDAPRQVEIAWSPELKSTIEEALEVKRFEGAPQDYVFGNLNGRPYTKGGWKPALGQLMDEAAMEASQRGVAFTKFSLQDCRPAGVTRKLIDKHTDVLDATLHTSDRMVKAHYDRRVRRQASPVK